VQYNLPSQQGHEELLLSSNLAGTGKVDILQSVTSMALSVGSSPHGKAATAPTFSHGRRSPTGKATVSHSSAAESVFWNDTMVTWFEHLRD